MLNKQLGDVQLTDIVTTFTNVSIPALSINQICKSGAKIAEFAIDGTITNIFVPNTSNVKISADLTSGTKIASISVDSNKYDLFAPNFGIVILGTELTYADIIAKYASTAKQGDAYFNKSDGKLYIFDGMKFPDDGDGIELKGDKGDKGETGGKGDKGETGEKGDKGDKGDPQTAAEISSMISLDDYLKIIELPNYLSVVDTVPDDATQTANPNVIFLVKES